MLSRVIIISLFISVACAATGMGPLHKKPAEFAKKEGCFIKEINDVIPFGSTITPPGACMSIGCSTSMLDYATCGPSGTSGPNCFVTDTDLSKPYPACCPVLKCNHDKNLI